MNTNNIGRHTGRGGGVGLLAQVMKDGAERDKRERSYPFRNVNQAAQVEIGAAERRWLNPFTLKRGKIPVMLIYE